MIHSKFSTGSVPGIAVPTVRLITSSQNKTDEVQGIFRERAFATRVDAALTEIHPTPEMESLRLRGPPHYGDVARISILSKFDFLTRDASFHMLDGDTIMDSSWFQVARLGSPGILVASEFYSARFSDGSVIENRIAPIFACEASKIAKDCRVVWIETIATAKENEAGGFNAVVRQNIKECFTPPTPQGSGWSFDPCTCPDPILLARSRGQMSDADKLSRIADRKWDLPVQAANMGLLVSFAELAITGEKHKLSPRGSVFEMLVENLQSGR